MNYHLLVLVLNPVNFTASHVDTYIHRYRHLNKERWKHIGPHWEQSSMHCIHTVYNGEKWTSLIFTYFLKGCISGCRSPNEMGAKSTIFRNNHSLIVICKLMVSNFLWFIWWIYHFVIHPVVDAPAIPTIWKLYLN